MLNDILFGALAAFSGALISIALSVFLEAFRDKKTIVAIASLFGAVGFAFGASLFSALSTPINTNSWHVTAPPPQHNSPLDTSG